MKDKKGQALVEFIIIVPFLILILMAVIDYARIIETRISMEAMLEDIIIDEDYKLESSYTYHEESQGEEKSYYLGKKIDIYSPFLSLVVDNPYQIMVKRTIHEK